MIDNRIGMFQGIEVHSMSKAQFDTYYNSKELEGIIVLIEPNRELWYYNQFIGMLRLDGTVSLVKEPYVVEEEVAKKREREKKEVAGVEKEFAQYTKVVDEFFEKMK